MAVVTAVARQRGREAALVDVLGYVPPLPLRVQMADPPPIDSWIELELEAAALAGEAAGGAAGGAVRGRALAVLGPEERPGVDAQVVLRHHHIPDAFEPEVLRAASRLPADPDPRRVLTGEGRRRDLRHLVTVTIDGERSRDFDDAISVEALRDGGSRLWVHVADVGEYVAPGSVLDREAERRGTSVYFPERAIPMLPEHLSNGLCSLRPGVPRLALSVALDFDRAGAMRRQRACESLIQSDARLTYDQTFAYLSARGRFAPRDGVATPAAVAAAAEIAAAVGEMLVRAAGLYQQLLAQRRQRGALDLDLPAGDLVLDVEGKVVGFSLAPRHDAHRLIEEFMLAANEAVAAKLDHTAVPALYRIHETPGEERLSELVATLAAIGLPAPAVEELQRGPAGFARLLAAAGGGREATLANTLVLRSLQRARYHPRCLGHYALAAPAYCHFTSPIRRYPDLFVHRALKSLLRRAPPVESATPLDQLAESCSATEQRAEQAERELLQWRKTRLLARRVGDELAGTVTGVAEFGCFVQLDAFLVDGLVPISSLGPDYYELDARQIALVGAHSGERVRLGEAVRVRIVGARLRHRGLDLELVDDSSARLPRRREPRAGSRGPIRGARPSQAATVEERRARLHRRGRRRR